MRLITRKWVDPTAARLVNSKLVDVDGRELFIGPLTSEHTGFAEQIGMEKFRHILYSAMTERPNS